MTAVEERAFSSTNPAGELIATYTDPVRTDGSDAAYPAGTWIVTVHEADGDRYVTRARPEILDAFGIDR